MTLTFFLPAKAGLPKIPIPDQTDVLKAPKQSEYYPYRNKTVRFFLVSGALELLCCGIDGQITRSNRAIGACAVDRRCRWHPDKDPPLYLRSSGCQWRLKCTDISQNNTPIIIPDHSCLCHLLWLLWVGNASSNGETFTLSSQLDSQPVLMRCNVISVWAHFFFRNWDTYNAWLQEFLLDLLDSMPRLQLSNDHMCMIIFVLKECGVPDVPSLETLRRVQDGLRENGSVPTTRHETERGNIFYVNDIGAQIAKVSLGAPVPVTYYYMLLLFPCSRIQFTHNYRTSQILWFDPSFTSTPRFHPAL